jgi:hypothetical protein
MIILVQFRFSAVVVITRNPLGTLGNLFSTPGFWLPFDMKSPFREEKEGKGIEIDK